MYKIACTVLNLIPEFNILSWETSLRKKSYLLYLSPSAASIILIHSSCRRRGEGFKNHKACFSSFIQFSTDAIQLEVVTGESLFSGNGSNFEGTKAAKFLDFLVKNKNYLIMFHANEEKAWKFILHLSFCRFLENRYNIISNTC